MLLHETYVLYRTDIFLPSFQTEQTWELRLEEARRGRKGEMVEAACQGDESVSSSGGSRLMITTEELESRLTAQKRQLQLEADRLRQKAVEESRKHIQRELHKKHLEDMAKQVSWWPRAHFMQITQFTMNLAFHNSTLTAKGHEPYWFVF